MSEFTDIKLQAVVAVAQGRQLALHLHSAAFYIRIAPVQDQDMGGRGKENRKSRSGPATNQVFLSFVNGLFFLLWV